MESEQRKIDGSQGREGASPYVVMVEDETNNEVVWEWRGIKLVKVSFWRKS